MEQWVPVALVIVLALAVSAGLALVSHYLGLKRPNAEKLRAYECGVPPVGSTSERHSVRFYLIAMLFILFDIEVVFLYPWATAYYHLGVFGLVEMVMFLAVLVIGYIYAWKKGALEWQ
jgi:NADH-quinone oxidoreductase subunit A